MAGFEEFINNPMTMMGLGILGGNYGRNSKDAFANSMQGGLAGIQMGQLSSMRRKQQEQEQAEFEQKQKQYEAMKQQAIMQARTLGLDPNMFSDPKGVREFYNAQKGTGTQQNLAHYMSPEGQAQIDYISKKYGIPPADIIKMGGGSTNITVGGNSNFKVPAGFMTDPNDPGRVVPIPGGPQAQRAGETAGKEAMLDVARRFTPVIKNTLFSNGDVATGAIDRKALLQMDANNFGIPGALVPEGAEAGNAYELGIQGITRTETGAAMPKEEVDNTRRRFQPNSFDSDKAIRNKYLAYEHFLNNAGDYLDPNRDKNGNWKVDFSKIYDDINVSEPKSDSTTNKTDEIVLDPEVEKALKAMGL